MNKKEVNELKKVFSDECGFMNFNKVVTAYVDAEKNIKYYNNQLYNTISQDLSELILANVKNVFKGNIGKGLREYAFPNSSSTQSLFYNTLKSKFLSDDETKDFIQHIIDTYECVSTYSIILMQCTYSVNKGNKAPKNNPDTEADNYIDYNFIICSLCPVELVFNGLVCTDTPEIVCEESHTRIVSKPTDGFIYPTFSNRSPDVNSVLVYTSKPKSPNVSLVTETLGCEFTLSVNEQKQAFKTILEGALGKELNYDMTTCINDLLIEKRDVNANETEPVRLDKSDIEKVLWEAGVSEDNVNNASKVYDSAIGDMKLDIQALTEDKITLSTGAFTITYNHNYTHLVNTKIINGKKVITIEVDEPITVNDINVAD